MNGCPQCGLDSGLYRDHIRGELQCDNCGWYEGKTLDDDADGAQ